MDTARSALIERVRVLLADEPSLREVSMFGGRSFMVREKMVVSAMKGGGLLVRIPRDRHAELIARPGVSQPEMGAGRSMRPGWISVSMPSLETDADLAFWLDVALQRDRPTSRSGDDR